MQEWIKLIINPIPILGLIESEVHPFQLFVVIAMDFIWRKKNDIIHNDASSTLEKDSFQLNATYQDYKKAWEHKTKNILKES